MSSLLSKNVNKRTCSPNVKMETEKHKSYKIYILIKVTRGCSVIRDNSVNGILKYEF